MFSRAEAIRRAAVRLASVLVLCTARLQAEQAAHDPALADALFEQGKTLLAAGDWTAACDRFRQSFELDPSVSTQVKIARCSEHEGRLATALGDYERALELNRTLPQTPARMQELDSFVRAAIEELAPRVPKLHLFVSPRATGLEARLDGISLSAERLDAPIPVDPGAHQLVFRAPGYREERATATALEGVTREVRIELISEAPASPVPPPSPRSFGPRQAERTLAPAPRLGTQRTAAIVLAGVGIAAVGVGTMFGLQARARNDDAEAICADNPVDCPEAEIDRHAELVDDAKRARSLAVAGFVAGGASLLAGAALWFSAGDAPQARGSVLILAPAAAGSGLQAALRGRF